MKSSTGCLLDLDKTTKFSSTSPTGLVSRHNQLLKKNVVNFTVEDIRFLISQKTGLKILVPRTIEVLREDFLAEGDYFEGDLLLAVISIDESFWSRNTRLHKEIVDLINEFRKNNSDVSFSKDNEKSIAHFLNQR